jgi:hypothetical protein
MMWHLRSLIFLAASKPRIPPFSLVLTVWLSMAPAVGEPYFPSYSHASITR